MTLILPTRRELLRGLGLLIAAPAVVRASSLMPVRSIAPIITLQDYFDRILYPIYKQRMEEAWYDMVVYGTYITDEQGNRVDPTTVYPPGTFVDAPR